MISISKPIINKEEREAVNKVLDSGMIAQGQKVKELEEKFAKFCGTRYAIAVNSGTAAIHSALYAIGIKEGDEVITTPFTFVATANPILMQGGKIIFADIKKDTFNIDVEKIKEKITHKTKAIIVVDLFGQPADYEKIKKIAEEKNIKIIEDACQAHGAELNNKKAGNLGDIGCFSFYATKNMMCGEGGIITTNNEEYAELCKRFRHHGQSEKTNYEYEDIGYNYRMMDIQASIALEQLKKINEFNEKRRKNADKLIEGLKKIEGIEVPYIKEKVIHVFHQFTIKCDNKKINRDELSKYLKENGVGCGIYYPKPLHLHPHFKKIGYCKGDFPISEEMSKRVLSLPVHPLIKDEEIEEIIKTTKRIYNKMNVGVIGIGNMGKNHVKNYFLNSEANLIAISDIDEGEGEIIAKKNNCKYYKDYIEMLDKEDLDMISIAVPTNLHKEIALECLKRKINVLLEKPIADSIKDAEEIIKMAKENNVKLLIGHLERYNPAVIELKKIIDKKIIGDLKSISIKRVGPMPNQIKDSNVILDLGIHDIDILNYIIGERPEKIKVNKGRAILKDREDYADIFLNYGKTSTIVQVNWISPIKIRKMEIFGSKGYLEMDYIKQKIKIINENEEKEVAIKKEFSLKREIENFIESIKGNEELKVKPEEALEALKIILGVK